MLKFLYFKDIILTRLFFTLLGAVVWSTERTWEQLMYAFVNMCTSMGLTKTETVDVMNAVTLGHSSAQPLDDRLDTWDISQKSGTSER